MAKRSSLLLPVMLLGLTQTGSCKITELQPTTVKPADANKHLCKAIEATRHDVIKTILNEGTDPNRQCKITYSIENNYSVGGRSWKTLEYPIYVALWKQDSVALDLLLERGADVNALNQDFPPALDYAIQNFDLQSMRVLLKHGAKPDSQGSSLEMAIRTSWADSDAQRLALIRLLLEHNAKVNFGDPLFVNPLLAAIKYQRDPELIALLIQKGADVNAAGIDGGTRVHALHLLYGVYTYSSSDVLTITKLLIAKGANVNATDSRQQTPLHLVAERRTGELLAQFAIALIANGANPELKDYQGKNFFDIVQAGIDQTIANAQMDAKYKRTPPPLPSGSVPSLSTAQRASQLAEIKAFWEKHKANR